MIDPSAILKALFGDDDEDKKPKAPSREDLAAQAAKRAGAAPAPVVAAGERIKWGDEKYGSVPGVLTVVGKDGKITQRTGAAGSEMYVDPAEAVKRWQVAMRDPKKAAQMKARLYFSGYYGADADDAYLGGDRFDMKDADALFKAMSDARPMKLDWEKYVEPRVQWGMANNEPFSNGLKKDKADPKAIARQNSAELEDLADYERSLREFGQRNGVRLAEDVLKGEIERYAAGETSLEATKKDWRERYLTSAFPGWADDLRAGKDLVDIANPYIAEMSETLEINPTSINLFTPEIRKALQSSGSDGRGAQKPLWEFQNELRDDSRWQYTNNAHAQVSSFAQSLKNHFGV